MAASAWTLALVQETPAAAPAANLARATEVLARLAGYGDDRPRLAVFPELFVSGYDLTRVAALALTTDGPELAALALACATSGIGLVIGFAERAGDGRLYDSAAVIDRRGERRGCYRKLHLYADERQVFSAGDRPGVFELDGLRLGVGICFDLEFPEYSRLLALAGAELLCFPTANMKPWQHYQQIYGPARALENQRFVAIVNRTGHEADMDFFGLSAAWGPDGACLARGPADQPWLGLARIDPARADAVAALPFHYLDERRPAAYGGLVRPRTR